MKKFSFIVVCSLSLTLFSQKNDPVLFSINDDPVLVSEFKRVYEKNIDIVDEDAKDIDKNLDLYINFKLKVKEAYALKLDTLSSYKNELNMYRKQLLEPYLQDETFHKQLVEEAYKRTKEEVRASHILVMFPKKGMTRDSLFLLKKLEDARNKIMSGASFEEVAKEVSEDPSVEINGGDLGYFSAFRMVYPFEDVAYLTQVGSVSKPFKTRFGYHILKVTDRRASKGMFKVAHILANDRSIVGKVSIDSAYTALVKGATFTDVAKRFSDDVGSASRGGELDKFGTGTMVEPFENAVRALKQEGDYSKPFKTKYGWHIVKLLKKYPVESFETLERELDRKVASSGRGALATEAVINRLKKKYVIKQNRPVVDKILSDKEVTDTTKELFSINSKKFTLKSYLDFHKFNKTTNAYSKFSSFLNHSLIAYYKNDIQHNNEDFKATFREYKEGLLLFELMQKKIWTKASRDTDGLENFFRDHSKIYNTDNLEEIKGKVISDYQEFLEREWLEDLKKETTIKINKKALKTIKKIYNQ